MFADFKYICLQTYSGLLVQRGLLDLKYRLFVDLIQAGDLIQYCFSCLQLSVCRPYTWHWSIYFPPLLLVLLLARFFYYSTWVWESVLHWTSPYTLLDQCSSGLLRLTSAGSALLWASLITAGSVLLWTSPYNFCWISTPLGFSV